MVLLRRNNLVRLLMWLWQELAASVAAVRASSNNKCFMINGNINYPTVI